MANTGNKFEVNLLQSINTDTINENVYSFGDAAAPLNSNTGIERLGGLQNLNETEELFTDNGYHFTATDGSEISCISSGVDDMIVNLDGVGIANVSRWGIKDRLDFQGFDDVLLTSDGKMIGINLISPTLISIKELDLLGYTLRQRNFTIGFTWTNIARIKIVNRTSITYDSAIELLIYSSKLNQLRVCKENTTYVYLSLSSQPVILWNDLELYCFKSANDSYLVAAVGDIDYSRLVATTDGGYVAVFDSAGTLKDRKYTNFCIPYFNGNAEEMHLATGNTDVYVGTFSDVFQVFPSRTTNIFTAIPQSNVTGVTGIPNFPTAKPIRCAGYGYSEVFCKNNNGGAISTYANYMSIYSAFAPNSNLYTGPTNGTTKSLYFNGSSLSTFWSGLGLICGTFGTEISVDNFPIQIRSGFVNGTQSFYSISESGSFDKLGTLLTDVGGIYSGFVPQVRKVSDNNYSFLYKRSKASYALVNISDETTFSRVQKVSDVLYKVNTISPHNLVSTEDKKIYLGSTDFNNRAIQLYGTTYDPNYSLQIESLISDKYSNSIDSGAKTYNFSHSGYKNFFPLPFYLYVSAINIRSGMIPYTKGVAIADLYIYNPAGGVSEFIYNSSRYKTSEGDADFYTILTDKVDTFYIEETRIPNPIGGTYGDNTMSMNNLTRFINKNYDCYELGSEVEGHYTSFILFGQQYVFDGEWVYSASLSNGILANVDKVAPATGLKYIASSPTAIYFLSEFDNSLYTFSGGRNLDKSKRFTAKGDIVKGVYSVRENSLILDTSDSIISIRDGVISENIKKATKTSIRLYDTINGTVYGNNTGKWQYTLFPTATSTIVPLELQTAYLGANNNIRSILKSIVLTIYTDKVENKTIKLTHESFDQSEWYTEDSILYVKASEFNDKGYARVRFQPKNQRNLGNAMKVYCEEKILLIEMAVIFDDEQSATIVAPTRRS